MASHRQTMIKIERMFKQIIEQNDTIIEIMESRLPEKKKRGPKNGKPIADEKVTEQPETPTDEPTTE